MPQKLNNSITFEEVIISNCSHKYKNLYKPAYIAYKNPGTGIEVKVQSAQFVIRDCAYIAYEYLPLFAYGDIVQKHGLKYLKGAFTYNQIKNFIASATTTSEASHITNVTNIAAKQLLTIILEDINNEYNKDVTEVLKTASAEIDVYGEYGNTSNIERGKTPYDRLVQYFTPIQ